jgi:hypothetical protein
MEFEVGDKVYFWYHSNLQNESDGSDYLYLGVIKAIGDERIIVERNDDKKLCSFPYEKLLGVDGTDFWQEAPPPPPPAKPPTHHEIMEARWVGMWMGVALGLIAATATGLIVLILW